MSRDAQRDRERINGRRLRAVHERRRGERNARRHAHGQLFQPELAGDGTRAHPLIRAFAAAAVERAAIAA